MLGVIGWLLWMMFVYSPAATRAERVSTTFRIRPLDRGRFCVERRYLGWWFKVGGSYYPTFDTVAQAQTYLDSERADIARENAVRATAPIVVSRQSPRCFPPPS